MHAASFMHALHTPLACKLAQVGGGVAFLYAMHLFWLRARRPAHLPPAPRTSKPHTHRSSFATFASPAVSAVHDGFVLQKSVASTPLAGQLLSQCMAAAVESRGTPIRPRFEFTRREGHGGKLEASREASALLLGSKQQRLMSPACWGRILGAAARCPACVTAAAAATALA
jgi:hypothetical protein